MTLRSAYFTGIDLGYQNLLVGAHVIVIDRRSDRSWWIVPMCKKHNNTHNQEPMYIKRDIEMVSANVYRTCHQGDWSWTVP